MSVEPRMPLAQLVGRLSADTAYSIALVARRRKRREKGDDAPARKRRRVRELEAPGSVLKGPRITVNCECGQTNYLAYGENWTCGSCGRMYDTNRIPRDDYE